MLRDQDIDEIVARLPTPDPGTHWEGCWSQHTLCAVHRLADQAKAYNQHLINCDKDLNRRANVERAMFDCIAGKKPMPDKEMLKEWALKLGVPDEYRKALVTGWGRREALRTRPGRGK